LKIGEKQRKTVQAYEEILQPRQENLHHCWTQQ